MSSMFGNKVKISVFGQSHSAAIGAVIDGLPAGEAIDQDALRAFMARRAPGKNAHSTQRREADEVRILSGLAGGKTCGAPLCGVIENTDAHSADYAGLEFVPRPSHADYPAFIKHSGHNDIRGGGHFSGRLTAPLCFAGGVCAQLLARRGIRIGAQLLALGGVRGESFLDRPPAISDFDRLAGMEAPALSERVADAMLAEVQRAREVSDSVGGIVECAALGLPPGLGEPMFDGVENLLSRAIFGIPGVRGIEFGAGFAAAEMRGSAHNDPYFYGDGAVRTETNNHGGVLGGLCTGMPLLFRVAFKPTPSIPREQRSVSLSQKRDCIVKIGGRHDPCIAIRALPVVEAVCAAVLLDLMTGG